MFELGNKLYAENIKNSGEWVITDHISRPVWVLPLTDYVREHGRKLTKRALDDCPNCGGTKREAHVWLGIGICRTCKGTGSRR